MLLAGLTEVPVTGIETRWMSIRVTPIAKPGIVPLPNLDVVARITKTNRKVMTASMRNAL